MKNIALDEDLGIPTVNEIAIEQYKNFIPTIILLFLTCHHPKPKAKSLSYTKTNKKYILYHGLRIKTTNLGAISEQISYCQVIQAYIYLYYLSLIEFTYYVTTVVLIVNLP